MRISHRPVAEWRENGRLRRKMDGDRNRAPLVPAVFLYSSADGAWNGEHILHKQAAGRLAD